MKNKEAIKKYLEKRLNSLEADKENEDGMFSAFMINTKEDAIVKFNISEADYFNLDNLAMDIAGYPGYKERTYYFDVNLKFSQAMEATSHKEAREQLKATFKEDFNLDITDKEIKSIDNNNL